MAARIEGERAIQAGFTIDNGVLGLEEKDKEVKTSAHYRPPPPEKLPWWAKSKCSVSDHADRALGKRHDG